MSESELTGYWVSEETVWKIFARSESETREVWRSYQNGSVDMEELPMTVKNYEVSADWKVDE